MEILPLLPAIRILNLPIRFPRSVKGRRLGILIEGITNCGADSCIGWCMSPSSSSLDATAWLDISSLVSSSSDFWMDLDDIDFGLLGREISWEGKGEGVERPSLRLGKPRPLSCMDDSRLKRSSSNALMVDLRLLLLRVLWFWSLGKVRCETRSVSSIVAFRLCTGDASST